MRMSNLVHMQNTGLTEVLVYFQTLLFGFKILEPYCTNLRFMVVVSNFQDRGCLYVVIKVGWNKAAVFLTDMRASR